MGHGHSRTGYPDPPQSGHSNANADALLRAPLEEDDSPSRKEVEGVIANIVSGKVGLTVSQRQVEKLLDVIRFLETGMLHSDENVAKKTALTASKYTLEDDILYHVETDGTYDSSLLLPNEKRCSIRPIAVHLEPT